MSQYQDVYDTIMQDMEARADSNAHMLDVLKETVAPLLPPNAKALDLGCGPGEPAAAYLVSQGYRVTGLDFAPSIVEIAQKKVPDAEFIRGDMLTWEPPSPGLYDLVLASHCFYNFPFAQIRTLAFKLAHWAKEGGIVAVVTSLKVEALEEKTLPFDAHGWAEGVPNLFLEHTFRCTYAEAHTWRTLLESTGLEYIDLNQRILQRPGMPDKRNITSFLTLRKTTKNPLLGPYHWPDIPGIAPPLTSSSQQGWNEFIKRINKDGIKRIADIIRQESFKDVLCIGLGAEEMMTSIGLQGQSIDFLKGPEKEFDDILPFPDGHFDAVIALGVFTFRPLDSLTKEILRVLSSRDPSCVIVVEGAPDNEFHNLLNNALTSQSKPAIHHGILLHGAAKHLQEAGFADATFVPFNNWLSFTDIEQEQREEKAAELLASLIDAEGGLQSVKAALKHQLEMQFAGRTEEIGCQAVMLIAKKGS
ncbi:hypothetical protein M422DRAFT_30635 [Sphaerobolus stellatus SS14]|uniref:Methyltransferase domain-containing protein n=1 Tax=Sphaerobolus stellatus (strain SS14) TaxID=990650 RepID=A0A0C9VAW1_SPHS4|nr:hypothetical protein M422DRAFT_30635 [Sphaerobolus stellatus SS14]